MAAPPAIENRRDKRVFGLNNASSCLRRLNLPGLDNEQDGVGPHVIVQDLISLSVLLKPTMVMS
jgi:hypothetical protein